MSIEFLLFDTHILIGYLDIIDVFRLVITNSKFYTLFHSHDFKDKLFLSKVYFAKNTDKLSFHVKSVYFTKLLDKLPQMDNLNVLYATHEIHLNSILKRRINSWFFQCLEPSSVMFYRSDQSTISCIENVKYAEINFKEKFSENSCFSVGFTTLKDFSTLFYQDWMLGWSSDSIGYHSDDGLICRDGSAVVRKKEKFSHNDIIGFGVNLENNHIFFTKNGILIFNQPYSFFWNTTIFPAIVMDSPILYQINHGEEEFKFMNFYETLYTQN